MLKKLHCPAAMTLAGISGGATAYIFGCGIIKRNPKMIVSGLTLMIVSGVAAFINGWNCVDDDEVV